MEQTTFNLQAILLAFVISALVSFALTPISVLAAKRLGAVDVPKDGRRMHKDSIPRFGGMAIFVASSISIAALAGYNDEIKSALICGALMYLLGAIDDVVSLRARVKLAGQLVIAIIAYFMGIRVYFIANYFGGEGRVMLGSAACFLITIIWIVGITNTINLMDGLDGLAAGVSAIICVCMAYIAYIHGDLYGMVVVCTSLVAIAGACIGFLPFNFSPAKTFMGDSGALYLGFMIAALSVISPLKRATVIATIVPAISLAVPIFDTIMAMFRRVIRGQSVMSADKEHLHHRLISQGYDHRRSVIMMYGITGIMGVAAILISRELYVDATVLIIVVITYVYVFATDPAHRKLYNINKIRAARQKAEREAEKAEREEELKKAKETVEEKKAASKASMERVSKGTGYVDAKKINLKTPIDKRDNKNTNRTTNK